MKICISTLMVAGGLLLNCNSVFALQPAGRDPLQDFDRRPVGGDTNQFVPSARLSAVERLRSRLPQAKVTFDPISRAPKQISADGQFLTGSNGEGKAVSAAVAASVAAKDPYRATKTFVKEHQELFGHGTEALDRAKIRREFVTPHNGMKTVVWEQQVDGIPLFESVFISHTTRKGELVNVSSQFLSDPEAAADRGVPNRKTIVAKPDVSARHAVTLAAQNIGMNIDDPAVVPVTDTNGAPKNDPEKRQFFKSAGFKGKVDAKLIWLPMNATQLRLCWDVTVMSRARGEMFRVLVDAQTGEPLLRHCLTEYISDATYRVYTSDSPSPFSPGYSAPTSSQPPLTNRVLITLPALDTNASPNGWIDDGVNETLGNNVDAHTDLNSDNVPDLPRPHGSPTRVFDFPLDLSQAPITYTNAAVVQLFYWNNFMHDKLYQLGFTEAAGNFQNNNFGRGGFGNDAVQADAQDGSGVNNANFSTPSDGSPGRMQMYIFTGVTPNRDGDLDAEVILHEYTHGLSNRRVGGGVGISALQSQGMGEGWSDFYAMALLSEAGDDVNAVYAYGGYVTYQLSGLTQNYYFGIRRYPYCTDMSKNPLTFKDIDPSQASSHAGIPVSPIIGNTANEVHNMGEVWCMTLREARANLITKYGWAVGNQLILQLVTDGMNLSPANPNFLQARDAILQADLVDTGGANRKELWTAFAKRGMGSSATSPSSSTTVGLVEAYDLPDSLLVTPANGLFSSGPLGGPFNPASQTYTLTNNSTNTITWTASKNATWLNLSATSGTLAPGGSAATVTVALNALASSLPVGSYSDTICFTNQTTGMVQTRSVSLHAGQVDYFTEIFDVSQNDLDYQTFTFTPNGSANYYAVCREVATNFPTDPTGGTIGSFSDDSYTQVTLSGTNRVSLYGFSTNVFYIGSNGYLTFGSGDTQYTESLSSHFNRLRISALFDDLYPPTGGTISWKQLADRMAVTYQGVPEIGTTDSNSFQIEMFFDGRIRITYLRIDAADGLAGLSQGLGVPADFLKSDLTSYGSCSVPLVVNLPANATEGDGVLAGAGQVRLFAPLTTNLTVALASSDTTEVTVPASVVIPAGQTNASFDVTIVDDAELDGTQSAIVSALAPGYLVGTASISVNDNETATLSVVLPSTATEGQGTVTGTVQVSAAPTANVTVSLSSSDTTEIQVPVSVVIPAGQTSAVFTATVVDDNLIDGPQIATVTAHVANWVNGSASITVLDNEAMNLTITLPASAWENAGTLTNAGSVAVSGLLTADLVVSLVSDRTDKLIVPATVTIPAGQSAKSFSLTVVDNAIADGNQTATVSASAAGFTNGSASLSVLDDETPLVPANPSPADFATNVIQTTSLSWQSGALAGQIITNDVYFGTNPTPGPAEYQGSTTNSSWTLPLLAPQTTYYWQIVARRIGQTTGPVWRFTTRGVDHFTWDTIASPQIVGQPFSTTITAKDAFNTIVSNFNGHVNLSATIGSGLGLLFGESFESGNFSSWTIGSAPMTRVVTNDTAADGSYSFTMIGGNSSHFQGVWHTLSNLMPTRVNFSVRASANNSAGGYFVLADAANGDATVNANTAVFFFMRDNGLMGLVEDVGGFHAVPYVANRWYQISLLFNWTNKTVDYYVDGTLAAAAIPFRGNSVSSLSIVHLYNFYYTQAWWDNIQFLQGDLPATNSISPTTSGNFVNGVWTGNITVQIPATNAVLRADDGYGHTGTSNPFNVGFTNDLSIDIAASPSPAAYGTNLTYTLTITNNGPADATGVTVTNSLPANVTFVSAVSSQGACTQSGGIVSCTLGIVPGGTNATVTVVVMPAVAGTTLTNVATVYRAEADYAGNNTAAIVTSVLPPTISIADAGCLEGNVGTTNLNFVVTLAGPSAQTVSVAYATADGSAVAGGDYVATNGVLIFPPGTTSKTVSVPVISDIVVETNKTFFVNLSSLTNGLPGRMQSVGTIIDDDGLPGDPYYITWSAIAPLQYNGQPFGVTVSVRDYFNNLATNYNGVMTLSCPTAAISPTNANFTNGIWTGSIAVLQRATNTVLRANDGNGHIGLSNPFDVVPANMPPIIVSQPTNQGVIAGGSALFSVIADGTPPLAYQWSFNGTKIGDATNSTLVLAGVQFAQAGNYTVQVTNAFGLVNSANAVLTLCAHHFAWSTIPATQLVGQPFSATITALDSFNSVISDFNGAVNLRAVWGGAMFSADFESGLQGLTINNSYGSGNGLWHLSTGRGSNSGHSTSHSLYYGHNEGANGGGNYDTGTANGGVVTSTSITLPPGTTPIILSFNYLMNVEPGTTWDQAIVEVSTNNGANYTVVASKANSLNYYTGGQWVSNSVALTPFAGSTILLRFRFDTIDSIANSTEGWYVDDINIQAGTSQIVSLIPTNTGAFSGGAWTGNITVQQSGTNIVLVADDGFGHTGTSNPMNVENPMAPVIVSQPTNSIATAGMTISFNVNAAGTLPLSFQWYKGNSALNDGGNISGGASPVLTLNNVLGGDAGNYFVVVSNVFGVATSSIASLTVIDPTIVAQPVDQFVNLGEDATFSVVAVGSMPLTYQWRRGGTPLTGATNTSLTVANVQTNDSGSTYDVIVANSFGSITSSVATLNIKLPLVDAFDPEADGLVNALVIQPDGKILAGGYFYALGGQVRSGLGRLNPDGSVDDNFDPEPDNGVICLAVQPDGKILAGGDFTSLGGMSRVRIGRLNADGTADTGFTSSANSRVNALVVQPDGKILVAGAFGNLGGQIRNRIGRLNANGTVDTSFNPNANNTINCLQMQADGKILVGGWFTTMGGQSRNYLARLNADGTVDTTFNPSVNASVTCLAVQADGKILVGGRFTVLGGQSHPYIGRLNADGSLDMTFYPGADGEVVTLAVQADGKILMGGWFTVLGGQSCAYFGRLNANGSLDAIFNPGADNEVVSLAVQADGKVVVGGGFATLGGQSRNYIARLNNTDPASESLAISGSNITWLRGGTLPEVWRTTFEQSVDGVSWTMLGSGTRIAGGWRWSGVLATSGMFRARGYATGGDGHSGGLLERALNLNQPSVATQPSSRTNVAGTTATFNVVAAGLAPFAYQWYKGSLPLTDVGNVFGSATPTLSLSNVLGGDAGNYQVVITNAYGSVTSSVASLTVLNDPKIITQPVSCTNFAGTTATLSVGIIGTTPMSYQWFKAGVPLSDGGNVYGSTNSTLSLSNVHIADAGNYSVVVTNVYGAVTSSPATLTVVDLVIQTQPLSRTNNAGTAAMFTVGMISPSSFSYQWYKGGMPLTNGTNISGSQTYTLTLNSVFGGDAGGYSVVITNVLGAVTSSVASLTVLNDPTIVAQPTSLTKNAGDTATFNVYVIGSAPLSYQWYKGNTPLTESGNVSGSTNAALSITSVLGGDAGNYYVVVTNAFGVVTSSIASLAVIDPMIVTQPYSQAVDLGQDATFSVVAAGSLPLTYQWRRGGTPLTGATNTSLTVANVQTNDSGSTYDVIVANSFGSITSSVATLIVNVGLVDAFDPEADGLVNALVIQPDGKILAGGYFGALGGAVRSGLGRLNPDGSVDNNFDPEPDNGVICLAVQPDGKIVAGGDFTSLGGMSRVRIGRLNADGTADTGFTSSANSRVNALVVQPDGKILVAGAFGNLGGQLRNRIGRLNAGGTVDTNFNPNANNTINCLQMQADGKILVGGYFTTMGGQNRNYLARLNADGTVDTSFNPGANLSVTCLAVQADGKILVGGRFTVLGGQSRAYIGRLNADGSLDMTFNPGADGEVVTLAVQADGKILVGGNFGTLGGELRNCLGRLNADGSIDTTFIVDADYVVQAIELQTDGKVVVGGGFATLGGQSRSYIGRLNNTGPAIESLALGVSNITWLRGGTLPEVWRTTFEQTTNGTSWMMLGNGTRIAGGWSWSGVVATNGMFRARGYATGGGGHSGGLVEAVLNLNLPSIVTQPVSRTNAAGTTATFNVMAAGIAPFAYHWHKGGAVMIDGGNVSGSTSNLLSLGNVQSVDAANYFVVISNNWGSVTSQVAHLTVTLPPLVIVTTNGTFGYTNGQFQFMLSGPQDANAIIFASPDLKAWTPLQTNPLINGSMIFTDLLATNFPQRYYKATLSP